LNKNYRTISTLYVKKRFSFTFFEREASKVIR